MNRKHKKPFAQTSDISVWLLLICILLLSVLLKLLCCYLNPIISRDGCKYIQIVQIWHDTNNFQELNDLFWGLWIPPLPLYLMKCLMNLGLSAETAGVCLNLILGTLAPLLTYGIAYNITQRKEIAICSALLIAVNPSMNALSIEVQRDMIYLFFIGSVLWLLSAGIRCQKWYYWLIGGGVSGCAMLTRFETLEFLAIVPLSLFLLCLTKHFPWKRGVYYAGLFFFCFIGSVFILSFLMQTQKCLVVNYESYFHNQFRFLQEYFQMDTDEVRK